MFKLDTSKESIILVDDFKDKELSNNRNANEIFDYLLGYTKDETKEMTISLAHTLYEFHNKNNSIEELYKLYTDEEWPEYIDDKNFSYFSYSCFVFLESYFEEVKRQKENNVPIEQILEYIKNMPGYGLCYISELMVLYGSGYTGEPMSQNAFELSDRLYYLDYFIKELKKQGFKLICETDDISYLGMIKYLLEYGEMPSITIVDSNLNVDEKGFMSFKQNRKSLK